ncbi:hypothetical protein RV18_GL002564 [Enterococcus termitis]|nr:hypothetical protein RV18_GL002564 [Enterococcus termitis]
MIVKNEAVVEMDYLAYHDLEALTSLLQIKFFYLNVSKRKEE